MSYATSQWLQLAAWYLAVIEFILMLYMLLLNPRHAANRGAAAIFLVITLNTLSIGLVLDPTPVYRIGLSLYVATATVVVVGLLIVTVMLVKREWLPTGWGIGAQRIWWPVFALGALPAVLTLVDVVFGTRLWYTPPAGYAGGFVALKEAASGTVSSFLRPAMTYVVGSLPVLILIYVLARDRKVPALTRQLAWLLLSVQAVALALMSTLHGPVLTPLITLLVGMLYVTVFAYAAFRQMISERRAQAGRLQLRLTALLLAVALPLFVGMMGVVLSRADTALQVKSDEGLASAHRLVAANTTTWLDLNVAALNQLVLLPQIISMDAAQQKPILEAMAAAHPHMYVVLTTDRQGMDVARSDAEAPKGYSDRLWFKRAVGGAPLALQPLISRTTGRPALIVAEPIRQESGEIVGVGLFGSELTDVAKQVHLGVVGEAGFSYVVDADNLVVASPETMPAGLGEVGSSVPITSLADLSEYPPVKALRAGSRGRIEFRDETGRLWQAYVDEIKYGWGVVVQQPDDDFVSGLRGLQQVAFSFIGGGLALLVGLTVLTVRQAIRPIGTLTETATAIAGGDLERVAPVESEDEIGLLARAFNSMTQQLRTFIGSLEQQVEQRTAELARRTGYLEATADVSRSVASILDPDEMMRQMVELIRDRFGLYYVGLFLVDPAKEWAVLRAGTGRAGQAMLARGHRLRVGEGMIGWSVAHGEARVALEAGADAVRLATEELPDTRSEAALPLRSRGQVLGALTVQHTEPGAFDPATLAVLQTMADQMAVALDNAQLLAQSQRALEAERRAYGELGRRAWTELLQAWRGRGYRYVQKAITTAGGEWGPEMLQAQQTGQIVPGNGEGGAVLAVPIKLRDQVLGVLRLQKGTDGAGWSREEIALLEDLSLQLSVALESARLYSDTQRRAAYERLVGEVAARMRETLDVETVLKSAANEMRAALGLERLVVRLGMPKPEDQPQAGSEAKR